MRSVAGLFSGLMGAVSGTAAVEFSLILFFILMPFLFGIFEIGRALEQHHVVTKSVRDAARFVARTRDDTKDPPELFTVANPIEVGCAGTGALAPGGPSALTAAGNAKDLAMYGKLIPNSTDTPLMAAWDAAADYLAAYQRVCITGPVPPATPVVVNGETLDIEVVTVTATVPFEDILLRAFGIGPITFTVSHEERYISE